MIQDSRIKILNSQTTKEKEYIVYWMQSSQRCNYNHALEYTIDRANRLGKKVMVFFGLTDNYPEANSRHYQFMLEGLREVKRELNGRGILFFVQKVSPEKGIVELCDLAAEVIVDRGYLKIERTWRAWAGNCLPCPLIQVETNVIVPIEEVSNKEEYSAATIRPKIHRLLEDYLLPLRKRVVENKSHLEESKFFEKAIDFSNIETIVRDLQLEQRIPAATKFFPGGTSQAEKRFKDFLLEKIEFYGTLRNDPGKNFVSDMSPYLHFGQISPLYLVMKLKEAELETGKEFMEELVIRRELSMNYVYFQECYDSYRGIPNWAQKSLAKHTGDAREYLYSREEFENSKTHDVFWNAAQKEMVLTGKMNGYMRMYWGKKIIEWTKTPEEAFEIAVYLNNKYNLDGRDPNGFTGVAWCFGKHDRPWKEREIFGMIRYMNEAGLKRKFKMDEYLKKVASFEGRK